LVKWFLSHSNELRVTHLIERAYIYKWLILRTLLCQILLIDYLWYFFFGGTPSRYLNPSTLDIIIDTIVSLEVSLNPNVFFRCGWMVSCRDEMVDQEALMRGTHLLGCDRARLFHGRKFFWRVFLSLRHNFWRHFQGFRS
jgi:hypothetical protein